ncbi:MAG: hypothetical protein IPK79_06980 [Vampirovibrionales bacterium]|nr:hypothetical protein [Vampirovibrionales bacterium]
MFSLFKKSSSQGGTASQADEKGASALVPREGVSRFTGESLVSAPVDFGLKGDGWRFEQPAPAPMAHATTPLADTESLPLFSSPAPDSGSAVERPLPDFDAPDDFAGLSDPARDDASPASASSWEDPFFPDDFGLPMGNSPEPTVDPALSPETSFEASPGVSSDRAFETSLGAASETFSPETSSSEMSSVEGFSEGFSAQTPALAFEAEDPHASQTAAYRFGDETPFAPSLEGSAETAAPAAESAEDFGSGFGADSGVTAASGFEPAGFEIETPAPDAGYGYGDDAALTPSSESLEGFDSGFGADSGVTAASGFEPAGFEIETPAPDVGYGYGDDAALTPSSESLEGFDSGFGADSGVTAASGFEPAGFEIETPAPDAGYGYGDDAALTPSSESLEGFDSGFGADSGVTAASGFEPAGFEIETPAPDVGYGYGDDAALTPSSESLEGFDSGFGADSGVTAASGFEPAGFEIETPAPDAGYGYGDDAALTPSSESLEDFGSGFEIQTPNPQSPYGIGEPLSFDAAPLGDAGASALADFEINPSSAQTEDADDTPTLNLSGFDADFAPSAGPSAETDDATATLDEMFGSSKNAFDSLGAETGMTPEAGAYAVWPESDPEPVIDLSGALTSDLAFAPADAIADLRADQTLEELAPIPSDFPESFSHPQAYDILSPESVAAFYPDGAAPMESYYGDERLTTESLLSEMDTLIYPSENALGADDFAAILPYQDPFTAELPETMIPADPSPSAFSGSALPMDDADEVARANARLEESMADFSPAEPIADDATAFAAGPSLSDEPAPAAGGSEDFRVLETCAIDPACRLFVVEMDRIFALMGECGPEDAPSVEVLKVFREYPFAQGPTFTVSEDGPQRYAVQVGAWRGIVAREGDTQLSLAQDGGFQDGSLQNGGVSG